MTRMVEFEVTHQLTDRTFLKRWREDSQHCPCCGEAQLWVESGDGDYYHGPTVVCLACGEHGNISFGGSNKWSDEAVEQIKQALKETDPQKDQQTGEQK